MSGAFISGLVETGSPSYSDGTPVSATFTADGSLRVTVSSGGGGGVAIRGAAAPADAYANPSDAIPSWALNGHALRGTNTWYESRGGYVAAIPSADLNGVVNSLATGVYRSTPPTLADGQGYSLRVDSSGALVVSSGATTVTLQDNIALNGTSQPASVAALFHRNQGNNGYWSRGGYIGGIVAADVPAVLNVFATAAFSSSAPTLASGRGVTHQADQAGNLIIIGGAPFPSNRSIATPKSASGDRGEIKSSTGNVLGFDVTLLDAGPYYLFLIAHNGNPANGDSGAWRQLLNSTRPFVQVDRSMLGDTGLYGATGWCWGLSSTLATFTLASITNGVLLNVSYV